jgi:ribosomal protein L37AE/L43A
MIPNPTALRSLVKQEDVEKHRSLSCANYDCCLDSVLRHAWRSWSCERCELFRLTAVWRTAEIAHEAALRPLA